ncbi:hypothetical protein [Clostridium rectalis]|uniref:hypothetical protein n=1 Tax=Clostridium rectalis TaxID=2040295 RepID=UPI000F6351A1|nr:hypothetical protein [Clostridium rectalis]
MKNHIKKIIITFTLVTCAVCTIIMSKVVTPNSTPSTKPSNKPSNKSNDKINISGNKSNRSTEEDVQNKSTSGGDEKLFININSGVVKIIPGNSDEPKFEYDKSLCSVNTHKDEFSRTITVTSKKSLNSWAGKICTIYTPKTIKSLKVNNDISGITTISDFNVNLDINGKGMTSLNLPDNFSSNVKVTTKNVTNVVIPANINNATFTCTNRGSGLIKLPFDDYDFLMKSYSKVFGNGHQSYYFEAQGQAMLTISF